MWIIYYIMIQLVCQNVSPDMTVMEIMDRLADVIEQMNTTIMDNHKKIQLMEKDNCRMQSEIEELKNEKGHGLNDSLNVSVDRSPSKDMERLQETMEMIQNENNRLKNEIEEHLNVSVDQTEDVERLQTSIKFIQEENSRIKLEMIRYQEGENKTLMFQNHMNKTADVLRGMVANVITTQEQQGQQQQRQQQQQGQQINDVQAEVAELKTLKWPRGTFGLPMPKLSCVKSATGNSDEQSACPSGTWTTGSRYQDTENNSPSTLVEPSNQCVTDSWSSSGITLKHCLNREVGRYFRLNWPEGSYCIYKVGACPTGFTSGKIGWDDEDTNNGNTVTGYSMDGTFNSGTIREFCCREDGLTTAAIYLPMEKPFYLFAKTEHCQQVNGMNVRADTVYWDDENSMNENDRTGSVPYLHGTTRDTKLTFCYYMKA